MISRKAKKLVPAREQLQALTPAELTQVSGGCGWGGEDSYGGDGSWGSYGSWGRDDCYRHDWYHRRCHNWGGSWDFSTK